jgi:hypothetical protein
MALACVQRHVPNSHTFCAMQRLLQVVDLLWINDLPAASLPTLSA